MIGYAGSVLALIISMALPTLAAEMPPPDFVEPVTGMQFMAVPGGNFVMGSNAERSASPEREVSIKPFMLSRYEVTYEQYAKFCSAKGRTLPSDNGWGMGNRPVVNVSWRDAVSFTEWLSEKSGKKFRLPSEAEWEYAARGGMATPFPWGSELGSNRANCRECGSEWDGKQTAPVGSFAPNGYGLYDMIGNVYEWCLDAMYGDYAGAQADGSARLGDGNARERITRGGSWIRGAADMTVFRRCWDPAEKGTREIGIRVLLER